MTAPSWPAAAGEEDQRNADIDDGKQSEPESFTTAEVKVRLWTPALLSRYYYCYCVSASRGARFARLPGGAAARMWRADSRLASG